MGLFTKKEEKKGEMSRLPELPKLPELPDFPEMKDDYSNEKISQLPSFPNGSLGNKFSQYNIKEAVSGKKEEEGEDANDFAEDETEMPTMRKPLVIEEKRKSVYSQIQKTREAEPIFVRIDKFEEGSKIFEDAKRQISDIEKMFDDLKKVKESEGEELKNFEEELRQIKEKIEKIDENIFSKVE
ncbi:MAG: hypothetical protein AABX99_01525 [Nanoarchaeota archaeon]